MHNLYIDLETYSSVDIKTGGLYKYVQSPDFQILLFAWAMDNGPVEVIDLASGEKLSPQLICALSDPGTYKHAYNAAFEWYCLSKVFNRGMPLPLWQWRCTMLHSMYCGYPGSLDAAGKALQLPEDQRKKSTGSALIRTFCVPCKPTARNGQRTRTLPHHEPEKWELFKQYNAQDVSTEMEVERRLSTWPVPVEIQWQWELDLTMNARGVAVDLTLVSGALACSDETTELLTREAISLTGMSNPNSVAQLKSWIAEETGEDVESLNKGTVKDLLDKDLESDTARRMLEIRQELGKTSVKKYAAMANAVCEDGRVRGLLQFYGANRTGRWAGRLVQVQNLPRTHLEAIELARDLVKAQKTDALRIIYGSVLDTLSQLIRTAFVPASGNLFIDADFSSIEARVISWLAGEQWRLDVFRTHGKIYEASASQMFGVPLEKIIKGNPEYELRQRGKVAELALGYQGGVKALTKMDIAKSLTDEEKPGIVQRWRRANSRIVDLWYKVQAAAIAAVKTGQQTGVNGLLFTLEGENETGQFFLTITLPSGRKLFYCRPFIVQGEYGDNLRYWGVNQTSKKWCRLETYGGKLVENIVQAIARDCMAEAITRLEKAGYPVVFHVHDEVVIDEKENRLDDVVHIMSQPVTWAPDLPLGADGWVGAFYTKD